MAAQAGVTRAGRNAQTAASSADNWAAESALDKAGIRRFQLVPKIL